MNAPAADGCKRSLANGKVDVAVKVNDGGVFDVHHPTWPVASDLRRRV